ncbi:MAG: hypothetical protein ACYCR7_05720, partial [Thermoplasmataceae archaeon]
MKVKKVIALSLVFLIISSSLILFYPVIREDNYRASFNQNPLESGSYLIYKFYSNSNQSKGATIIGWPMCGILKLTAISNSEISAKAKVCFPSGGNFRGGTYYWNNTYGINSNFISYFLNKVSLSQPLVNISGVISKVSGAYLFPNNMYLQKNVSGCTKPTILDPINVNETLASKNREYSVCSAIDPNKFTYDQAGRYNVLVTSGINGNISLISEIFHKTMAYSIGFRIYLSKTNIALNPLDYKLYLLEDLQYLFVLWFVGIPLLLLVIRNAKKRALKKL